jgi:type II secretory pathway pseudopilin PulG
MTFGIVILLAIVGLAAVASLSVLVYKNNQKKADAVVKAAQDKFDELKDKAKEAIDSAKK